jgi:hypothetical protein
MYSGKFTTLQTGVTTIHRVIGIRENPGDASLAGFNLKGTIDMAEPTIGFFSLHVILRFQTMLVFSGIVHNKTFLTVFYEFIYNSPRRRKNKHFQESP